MVSRCTSVKWWNCLECGMVLLLVGCRGIGGVMVYVCECWICIEHGMVLQPCRDGGAAGVGDR